MTKWIQKSKPWNDLQVIGEVIGHVPYTTLYKADNIPHGINVFNISKLAWNWQEQVQVKLKKRKDEWNGFMMVGKVIGTAVQDEYIKRDSTWLKEQLLQITLPFKWKNRDLSHIILIGHPDLLNRHKKRLIELKTSVFNNDIKDYAMLQAAAYWSVLKKLEGVNYETKVIKVAIPPKEQLMSDDMKTRYATELFNRAYLCAKELDKLAKTKK